jgi:hypothetical protein
MLDEIQQFVLEFVDFPQVGLANVGRQNGHVAPMFH